MRKPKSPGGEIMAKVTTHITEAGIEGAGFAAFRLDHLPAPSDTALVSKRAHSIGWRLRVRGLEVTLTKV